MVYIPGGEFWRGTNEADRSDDNQGTNTPLNANDARPRHRATTGAFFIDKTEVTNAQYQKYCEATGYPVPPSWTGGKFPAGQENIPVTRVNIYEASSYAAWAGKRLPTEAEWERAARGTDGRLFPWGNDWDRSRVAVGGGGPIAVGSRPTGATPEGVLDMSGNVFEWTSSWFDGYPNAPTKQPDFGTTLKVIRGGGWFSDGNSASAWYRSVNRPLSRLEWVGIRCVKDAP
jgi:formylglycine-generating enzyme required for sulfatase activity